MWTAQGRELQQRKVPRRLGPGRALPSLVSITAGSGLLRPCEALSGRVEGSQGVTPEFWRGFLGTSQAALSLGESLSFMRCRSERPQRPAGPTPLFAQDSCQRGLGTHLGHLNLQEELGLNPASQRPGLSFWDTLLRGDRRHWKPFKIPGWLPGHPAHNSAANRWCLIQRRAGNSSPSQA